MATTTTKLGLRKPDPNPTTGDFVDPANDLNNNWDKIDNAFGTAICTSTTRPSTPFVGQQAYETDTIAQIVCISTGPAVWRYTTVPQVASVSARNALTVYAGLRAFRFDIGVEQYYNGSVWLSTGPTRLNAVATGDLPIGTADGDIPGATLTFTTASANALARVRGDFDFRLTALGTGYCYGSLYVDGVRQTKQALYSTGAIETREPGSMGWDITLASTGSHTLKLSGHKDINSGTAWFAGAGSQISIELIQI